MAGFKVVISDPKTGMSVQREVKDDAVNGFLGKKVGEKISGELLDLAGYEFEISGGSDLCGFPMMPSLPGSSRRRIYTTQGVGIHKKIKFTKKGDRKIRRKRKGVKQRKSVSGNTVSPQVSQINLKILKHGAKPLIEKQESAQGESGEASKEENKQEAKPEVKGDK